MATLNRAIADLLAIEGAIGAAIVDLASGRALAVSGDPGFDLEVAAAGNAKVVQAKLDVMKAMGLRDHLDDILITLGRQYHLLNVLCSGGDGPNQFLYLVLNKDNANLALARYKLRAVAGSVRRQPA